MVAFTDDCDCLRSVDHDMYIFDFCQSVRHQHSIYVQQFNLMPSIAGIHLVYIPGNDCVRREHRAAFRHDGPFTMAPDSLG